MSYCFRLRCICDEVNIRVSCIQALYEKQGREKQFVSAAERDTYLQKELAQLQASAKQTADVRLQVDQQVADLGSQAMDMSQVPLLCYNASMYIMTQPPTNARLMWAPAMASHLCHA